MKRFDQFNVELFELMNNVAKFASGYVLIEFCMCIMVMGTVGIIVLVRNIFQLFFFRLRCCDYDSFQIA